MQKLLINLKSIYLRHHYIVILLVVFIIQSCGPSTAIEPKHKAPEVETILIDGSDFKLSDLAGNYVLLDFWASWCPPCLKEAPYLVALHRKFGDKELQEDAKFHIVSIALEKNDRSWKRTTERFGIDWKHQIVDETRFVAMSSLASAYGVTEIPAKFLIDPDGNFISIRPKVSEVDAYMTSKLKL